MELRHFRYFLAAAEELNISKASRRLNVSQPAMSRMIHVLEDELGNPLFVRERFGLALTPAGEKLLIYARQILDLSSEAVRVLRNQPSAATTITIGFIASSLGSFLGTTLKSFRESHPGIVVKIHELSPAAQVKALRRGQIDIALIGNPCGAVHDEFETRVLFEMRLTAALPASHRLAKRKLVSLKELEQDDFIGYVEESFPCRNQTIINACRVAGFKPNLRYQAESLVEVLAMIGSGAGVCLMPADMTNLPHPGVKFVSIREKLEPIRFTAAWRRDGDFSIIENLLGHIKRQQ
ncbi:MAG: LysR family transcriptional regulator [Deltaproteobacteria bacterium]|nr:LysR family transcriptional regulator [Deltaproteobacteria bacterium]